MGPCRAGVTTFAIFVCSVIPVKAEINDPVRSGIMITASPIKKPAQKRAFYQFEASAQSTLSKVLFSAKSSDMKLSSESSLMSSQRAGNLDAMVPVTVER